MDLQYPHSRIPLDTMIDLSVVVPVYNESEHIETLIKEWSNTLGQMGLVHEFVVINDGSTDGTGRVLDRLRKEMGHLRVLHQLNAGHGVAIRRGYEMARGKYILQTDANGRFEGEDMRALWEAKGTSRLVLAHRTHRLDGILRQMISGSVKQVTRLLFSVKASDPNVPFRLFEREPVVSFLRTLPRDWLTNNLAVSVYVARELPERLKEVKIPFRQRTIGKTSTSLRELCGLSFDSINELFRLRLLLRKARKRAGVLQAVKT